MTVSAETESLLVIGGFFTVVAVVRAILEWHRRSLQARGIRLFKRQREEDATP